MKTSKPTIRRKGNQVLCTLTTVLSLLPILAVAEPQWDYGKRGLEWSDAETGSYLWLGLRAQMRHVSDDNSFRMPSDFDKPENPATGVNRSRYKIGAGVSGDLTFYHEYDLRSSRLLDLRSTWTFNPRFNFRIGQWKADYNRERIDSSGKQQFIERSISTYWFTIDRQWGAMTSGRLWRGEPADSNWWAGVLSGNGRNGSNDGGRPMVMGRWQWNYTGNLLPFSQSALQRYEAPHGSLAFSAVSNDSAYTRFSSDGGGQLPGYEEGSSNQYRIYQAMQEWAWQKGGLNVQQELHWKSIEDRVNGSKRHMYGGYAQVGWFPSERWQSIPQPLEAALRGAYVNSDALNELENSELTLAINWFFNGHRNKLTFDASYLRAQDANSDEYDTRYRVQWELSI